MYPRTYANYTLLERLAVGGMSEVDLARRTVDDSGYVRFLVIKRIKTEKNADGSFVRMFKDEARISSALRHTNIAQVYDFGKVGEEYYLALEYVPGINLREIINLEARRDGAVPIRIGLRILHDVLLALEYAHGRSDHLGKPMSIVHRDCNPRNVMMSITGEVKLIDFGVARAADRLERTRTNHFKGKVAYMAPEQLHGKVIDHRADLFAMGLTLYELIHGKGAFQGLDQMQVMYRLVHGRIPPLNAEVSLEREVSRKLETFYQKATAPDAANRFRDAEDMREHLFRAVGGTQKMATDEEIIQYLDALDPQLRARIRQKMESYSVRLADIPVNEHPSTPLPLDSRDVSATMERDRGADRGTGSSTAPLIVAGALGTATLTVIALGIGVIGILLTIVAIQLSQTPSSDTQPPTDDATEAVLLPPEQTESAQPTTTTPTPQPTTSTGRRSRKTRGSTNNKKPDAPVSAPTTDTQTEELDGQMDNSESPPTVSPIVPRDRPPSVENPSPEDSDEVQYGMLQVTSDPRGRAIMLNGSSTPHVTPARIQWPIGSVRVEVQGFPAQQIELLADQRRIVSFR